MTNFLFKVPLRIFAQDLQKFAGNDTTIARKFLSSLSEISESTNNRTIDYLVHTLGFSKDSALAAAKRIHLKTTANPDSVIALFKAYGFTLSDTASIFCRNPNLLLADPDTTLKPKFEFLSRNGFTGHVLVDVISSDPEILRRSLKKQIVPCIDFLRNFFGSTDVLVSLFSARRGTWVLRKFSESVAPNIELLRAIGVPDSKIAKIFWVRPWTLARDAEEFSDIVEKTKEAGFSPSSPMFIYGLCTFSGMKKDKWLSKLHIFTSFGWSEEQFQSLFLKQPTFMNSSEEKIKRALDFFMNKLDWTHEEISRYPIVLYLSFEKRVVPRSSILQHLVSKGFIKKTSFGRAFMISEDKFLVKFVMQYLSEDPHLLEMYQKKMAVL
ncbi:uncharacterized protein LOC111798674 isoform X1 [Cucurbita pepo subsp. pepo]|uniref:uncharacterized protein LOC111798674 isoform X1 n=1 Tax=Cucurbita pepo subsp. pepo TaxID=3664 RepID=UPI000C9D2F25|nr:uncharacterized protein LOC111798674 isoform X1 [Cucurbita pepo subsp. pepo]